MALKTQTQCQIKPSSNSFGNNLLWLTAAETYRTEHQEHDLQEPNRTLLLVRLHLWVCVSKLEEPVATTLGFKQQRKRFWKKRRQWSSYTSVYKFIIMSVVHCFFYPNDIKFCARLIDGLVMFIHKFTVLLKSITLELKQKESTSCGQICGSLFWWLHQNHFNSCTQEGIIWHILMTERQT